MKVREVVRLLEADGWIYQYSRGDHHYYKHPTKPGKITLPGKGSDTLHPKTLNSILKMAELD
jgi:predicted RNA binding protein YcfA (HicA-like mRNA interferase family)